MFSFLRCRSWYTFDLGSLRPAHIAKFAAEDQMARVGLVDRSLFGMGLFAWACAREAFPLRPVFGLEVLLRKGDGVRPLALIARDAGGYRNLERIVTRYDRNGRGAVLDRDGLAPLAQGLLAICGTPDGWTRHFVGGGNPAAARSHLNDLKELFDGHAYLEAVPVPLEESRAQDAAVVLEGSPMVELGLRAPAQLVRSLLEGASAGPLSPAAWAFALGRLEQETGAAQVAAPLVASGRGPGAFPWSDPVWIWQGSGYALPHLHRVATITEGIEDLKVEPSRTARLDSPSAVEAFQRLCRGGLDARLAEGRLGSREAYQARLEEELAWIAGSNAASQWVEGFTLAHQVIGLFRARGVPVGPGFTRFTSCLVAWALGLHETDPLKGGLSSVEFLKPGLPTDSRSRITLHLGFAGALGVLRDLANVRPDARALTTWGQERPSALADLTTLPIRARMALAPALLQADDPGHPRMLWSRLAFPGEEAEPPEWRPEGWTFPILPTQWWGDPGAEPSGIPCLVLAHDPALDRVQWLESEIRHRGWEVEVPGEEGRFPDLPAFDGGDFSEWADPTGRDIWRQLGPATFPEVMLFFALWEVRKLGPALETCLKGPATIPLWAQEILAPTRGWVLFRQQMEALARLGGLSCEDWAVILAAQSMESRSWPEVSALVMRALQNRGFAQVDLLERTFLVPADSLASQGHCLARARLLWRHAGLAHQLARGADPMPGKEVTTSGAATPSRESNVIP